MYKLYTVTKNKTGILGFWKDKNGKVFRDRINIIFCKIPLDLYMFQKIKNNLFLNGEKSVFYIRDRIAYIESKNGQKQYLRHYITWQEKKLRPSLIKELVLQHNGLTVYKNENGFTFEIWRK